MKYRYFFLILFFFSCHNRDRFDTWEVYKGSPEGIHYSSLKQIDTTNVGKLDVAWIYHTGDADTVHNSQIQCNAIIVDSLLVATSPQMKLFALNAGTGKVKWTFNPIDSGSLADKNSFFVLNNCRGVAFWSDKHNDRRVFYVAGSYLYCINSANGRPVLQFADSGRLDLHSGLDREVNDLFVTATSPPIIYKDILILGSRVDEGPMAAPGHIRAYDVRTGKRRWIFHTIPHPGEPGYETWQDSAAYKFIGGANAWSGFTLDEKRGIVYASVGSASYDFYGGRRIGNDLFANCVLALDATNGKELWHYQTVHHDVWDRDLSSPPVLTTIRKNGKTIDAAVVTTKTGFIYVFDRITGRPVYDIIERPAPNRSELKGEELSATQPFPTAPASFMRQSFTVNDINPYLTEASFSDVKRRWATYKHDNVYDPISRAGTIIFPGLDGGAVWGGPSFDPTTGVLYINANEMAWVLTAVDISSKPSTENFQQAGKRLYRRNCMGCHGSEKQGSGNFPSLQGVEKKYTRYAFFKLVKTGRRMMPAFKQLNENEQEAIASYVLNTKIGSKRLFIDTGDDSVFRLPYTISGYNKFLSKEGYPAIAPPWGTLSAIDLGTGTYLWKIPLGNDTSFKTAKEPTGTENYGGSVVTAGGLLFIAATKDSKLRAFNKRTGQLLWEYNLPAAAFATPSIYQVGDKQYIVIACGGGKLKTKSGDSYIAFSLPSQ
ncbi:MAG: outer membrane protein assembly factor BamB family protein [Flavisolibacter sp.]